MAAYRYRAARADGRIVSGSLDAVSAAQAGVVLMERGLHPVAMREAPAAARRRTAGRRELAVVFRGIATLVAAGVPLERAVGAAEPLARGPLKPLLAEARRHLREGRTLAQALDAGDGVVPGVVIGMVRAGERGSRLAPALEQVATHLEQEADLAAKVAQALAYPALLAVTGTASMLVIGTVVVPKFAALLADLGQELPPATRILLVVSAFVSEHAIALAAGLALTFAAVTSFVRQPAGELLLHRALLALPLVRTVRLTLATARLGRALGGMLRSGMPILAALDGAREAAGDRAVGERVGRSRERVARGEPLTASLEREGAATPVALQLLAVGEGSGQLAAMAERAGDLAAQEADRAIRTLVTLLEPALIVTFGGLVAFVAAALLQAVYGIRPGG